MPVTAPPARWGRPAAEGRRGGSEGRRGVGFVLAPLRNFAGFRPFGDGARLARAGPAASLVKNRKIKYK